MAFTITTRYNRAAVESLLFASTLSSSVITASVTSQSKNAMVLREGHSGGSFANANNDPRGRRISEKTRASNTGSLLKGQDK